MLELKARPTSAMHVVPTAKFRSLKTVRSRIGSAVVSSRTMKPTSVHDASTNSAMISRESNQSSFSPRSRASCRKPNPNIIRKSPATSMRRGLLTHGESNRSEEHTSELQSRLHLVCRLLLEKKKKIDIAITDPTLML